jgi:hypothetical protein
MVNNSQSIGDFKGAGAFKYNTKKVHEKKNHEVFKNTTPKVELYGKVKAPKAAPSPKFRVPRAK